MTSDSSSADLFAIGGDFPAMASGGVDAGVKSNLGRSIPYVISDHDHGLPASFSSLSHWPECDLSLTNIFGQDPGDHIGSTKTSAPVVESNNNSKATRGLTEDHAVELEDLLAYSPCGKTRAAEAHEEPETGKNMVGVLLESSQVFLDTLQRFKGLQTSRQEKQSSCSPPSSEYSYIDSPDEMEVFSNKDTADTHESLPTTHRRTENEDSGDGTDDLLKSPEALRCSNQTTAMAPSMLSPQQSGFFSMPTTFTIISCYMWLFRGYEAVFAAIHNALLTQKIQRHQWIQESTNKRHGKEMGPAILPDINMGGFGLKCHPHLQIEMLIHVSCQMLQRIESVLGIDPTSRESCALQTTLTETQNGVLNLTSAPTLLHRFLHGTDSGSDGEGPNSARLSLVHGIVKSIRHTLRGGRD
ncbi:cytochalasin cluster regulator ccsR [Colletotrichum liriopes]|uniref:Cytochalasin cluster regulator ccsR n=1 Tax=Colletotrichum liriopes TaxID=708192 RepID=A0AA37LPF8_9PEZI|nr:cytochalasin cluster regulator ccsR [Colletotrichum liriopes]